MKIPAIQGVIRRRILLNYRVQAAVAEKILPPGFRPKLIEGNAIAGICLIRLEEIRPKGFPAFLGISNENSAHRVAVEWEDDSRETKEGVFVPRRDTDSRLNALAGGRIFPGVHHLSVFKIADAGGEISIRVQPAQEAAPLIDLKVSETEQFPADSVFGSLHEASRFFEAGCIGYSSRPNSRKLDGLQLKATDWEVSPLKIHRMSSSYYDDLSLFPKGSIELDHALLMRDIPHEWHSEPEINPE